MAIENIVKTGENDGGCYVYKATVDSKGDAVRTRRGIFGVENNLTDGGEGGAEDKVEVEVLSVV